VNGECSKGIHAPSIRHHPLLSSSAYGHRQARAGVFASGLPVLEVESGGQAVEDRLAKTIADAKAAGAGAVVLGWAGMSRLRRGLSSGTGTMLIDGIVASAFIAQALASR
tara:strand:- start:1979 stop:2308 length:330 start_codon:yes stop_codon:yes gene_type:complete